MADKQLIIVVEGTAAMGPFWNTILSLYLDSIISSFCAIDATVQNSSGSTFELALVMFNTHGPYSACLVRRSGWTRDVENFLGWLHNLSFSGGGWNDVAIAEGLAEALMMFAIPQNGYHAQQNLEGKRHCVLIAASNPYPLPTPVYRPAIENLELAENDEPQTANLLHDAETVSKWFGQCSISLSVICPKQLPKLREIYHAARHSQSTSELVVNVKQPHFLVLISDIFNEACAALSRSGMSPGQNPVSTSTPGPALPLSLPSENGSTLSRPPVYTGNAPEATIKMEPSTVTSSLHSSSPPLPQGIITNFDNNPEVKPMVNNVSGPQKSVGLPKSIGPPAVSGRGTITGTSQPLQNPAFNSLSTASANSTLGVSQSSTSLRGGVNNSVGLPISTAQSGANMNPSIISNFATNGGPSGNESMMPTPGMSKQGQGMSSVGMNTSASNLIMSQQGSTSVQSSQNKYTKVWEGDLSGMKDGKAVVITKLEGYRTSTAPETLAANWPPTMQLVRLISQDHMNNKLYVGKADFLVFRAMTPHAFLLQLQEKKLCAVIQLPSQTLLLSVSDKPYRLIGMLFPEDTLKPQISSQVGQQQQMQKQHAQQHRQEQQSQPQQVNDASYMQANPGRPQLVPQGQVLSQGTSPNMGGSGVMG